MSPITPRQRSRALREDGGCVARESAISPAYRRLVDEGTNRIERWGIGKLSATALRPRSQSPP
jgi:hypothetical protein